MCWNPCTSTGPKFRSIYAVDPKTLIPSLRGDAVVTDRRIGPSCVPLFPRPGSAIGIPYLLTNVERTTSFRCVIEFYAAVYPARSITGQWIPVGAISIPSVTGAIILFKKPLNGACLPIYSNRSGTCQRAQTRGAVWPSTRTRYINLSSRGV